MFSTLLEKDGRSERDKLDRRRSAKLTVPSSSDARPLVYHSSVYSTVPRAGQLATADTVSLSLLRLRDQRQSCKRHVSDHYDDDLS